MSREGNRPAWFGDGFDDHDGELAEPEFDRTCREEPRWYSHRGPLGIWYFFGGILAVGVPFGLLVERFAMLRWMLIVVLATALVAGTIAALVSMIGVNAERRRTRPQREALVREAEALRLAYLAERRRVSAPASLEEIENFLRSHPREVARRLASQFDEYVNGDGSTLTVEHLEMIAKMLAEKRSDPDCEPLGPQGRFLKQLRTKLDRSW